MLWGWTFENQYSAVTDKVILLVSMQVKFQSRGRLQLSNLQRLNPSCPLEWVGGSNSSSDHCSSLS